MYNRTIFKIPLACITNSNGDYFSNKRKIIKFLLSNNIIIVRMHRVSTRNNYHKKIDWLVWSSH